MTALSKQVYWVIAVFTLATGLLGCMNKSAPNEAEALRIAVLNLGGQYTKDAQGKYQYSDKIKLDAVITKGDQDNNLNSLVSCMDDATPSKTLLEGKAVMLGVLCNQAVTQLVYYEQADKQGDIASDWPGYIAPTANIEGLRAAKQAWLKVLENKAFIKL